jgi:hypothetical protein
MPRREVRFMATQVKQTVVVGGQFHGAKVLGIVERECKATWVKGRVCKTDDNGKPVLDADKKRIMVPEYESVTWTNPARLIQTDRGFFAEYPDGKVVEQTVLYSAAGTRPDDLEREARGRLSQVAQIPLAANAANPDGETGTDVGEDEPPAA